MAYLTPQQYLASIGGRVTAYEDPSQQDPNEILQVTGDWLNRTGAPNLSARASTYRGGGGGGPTNLQRGMDGFGFEPAPQMWDSPPPGAAGRSPATTPPSGVGVPYGQPVLSGLQQLEKAGIARRPQATEADGPEGLMSKIGGFLRRPGISEAIGSFGGEMARTASQPGASFWTSLATGGDAARESLARSREEERLEADRAREEEDRAIQRAAQERVREVIDQLGPDATEEERASALLRAATEAAAGGNANLSNAIRLIAERYAPTVAGGRASSATDWTYHEDGSYLDPATGELKKGRVRVNRLTGEIFYQDPETRQWMIGGKSEYPEEGAIAGERTKDKDFYVGQGALRGLEEMRPHIFHMAGRDELTGEMVKGGQNFLAQMAATMDSATGEPPSTWIGRFLASEAREQLVGLDDEYVTGVLTGQIAALQTINPMVRYLSGAQMTNAEAARYYRALIPSWSDTVDQVRIKMIGLETMANAMQGIETVEGISAMLAPMDPRRTDANGNFIESDEAYKDRLRAYAEGQAQAIYNAAEIYLDDLDAKDAAGPQFGNN